MLVNAGYSDLIKPKCQKLVVFHQFSHLSLQNLKKNQTFIIKLNFAITHVHKMPYD